MPTNSMPTEYVSVFLRTVSYAECHTNRPSHISKFQNLKSQNILLKYFLSSLLEIF